MTYCRLSWSIFFLSVRFSVYIFVCLILYTFSVCLSKFCLFISFLICQLLYSYGQFNPVSIIFNLIFFQGPDDQYLYVNYSYFLGIKKLIIFLILDPRQMLCQCNQSGQPQGNKQNHLAEFGLKRNGETKRDNKSLREEKRTRKSKSEQREERK